MVKEYVNQMYLPSIRGRRVGGCHEPEFSWNFPGPRLLIALGIFALRVVDMSLDTIRVLFVVRGKRLLSWVLGFFQSAIFVVAISAALANLDNILSLLGYAAGFATGNVVGMMIEERLAIGHIQLTIMSSLRGAVIAEQLRAAGYAVTEISGRGRAARSAC